MNHDKNVYYQQLMEAMNNPEYFNGSNQILVTEIEEGRAAGQMPYCEETQNARGGVHGGALCTLVDVVAGAAAVSYGMTCVTLNISMNFLRQSRPGMLTCRAEVIKHGRTITFCKADVFDSEERQIATGEISYFMEPWSEGGAQ